MAANRLCLCKGFVQNRDNLQFSDFHRGDDPKFWIRNANTMFDHYSVPEEYRFLFARTHMDYEIYVDLQSISTPNDSWEALCDLLCEKFNKSAYNLNKQNESDAEVAVKDRDIQTFIVIAEEDDEEAITDSEVQKIDMSSGVNTDMHNALHVFDEISEREYDSALKVLDESTEKEGDNANGKVDHTQNSDYIIVDKVFDGISQRTWECLTILNNGNFGLMKTYEDNHTAWDPGKQACYEGCKHDSLHIGTLDADNIFTDHFGMHTIGSLTNHIKITTCLASAFDGTNQKRSARYKNQLTRTFWTAWKAHYSLHYLDLTSMLKAFKVVFVSKIVQWKVIMNGYLSLCLEIWNIEKSQLFWHMFQIGVLNKQQGHYRDVTDLAAYAGDNHATVESWYLATSPLASESLDWVVQWNVRVLNSWIYILKAGILGLNRILMSGLISFGLGDQPNKIFFDKMCLFDMLREGSDMDQWMEKARPCFAGLYMVLFEYNRLLGHVMCVIALDEWLVQDEDEFKEKQHSVSRLVQRLHTDDLSNEATGDAAMVLNKADQYVHHQFLDFMFRAIDKLCDLCIGYSAMTILEEGLTTNVSSTTLHNANAQQMAAATMRCICIYGEAHSYLNYLYKFQVVKKDHAAARPCFIRFYLNSTLQHAEVHFDEWLSTICKPGEFTKLVTKGWFTERGLEADMKTLTFFKIVGIYDHSLAIQLEIHF